MDELSLFGDVVDSVTVLVCAYFDIVVSVTSGLIDVTDGDRDAAMQ